MLPLLLATLWLPSTGWAAPKISCAGLRSLTSTGLSIETAETVPAAGNTPAYCRIRAHVIPDIRIEVDLPAEWNSRFLMQGNGGFAGDPLEGPLPPNAPRLAPLRRGFATAFSNTGHDNREEPAATFALNRQKLLDYAFRSLHVTAEVSKQLIEAYYGGKPTRSYYQGCSTGGRQGLMLAQRFPDDFDGIVAGAPVHEFCGTFLSFAWNAQALAAAPIPHANLLLLADRIYARCDEKDGLKDGLIDDPRRCDFDPTRDLPRCSETSISAQCFTEPQIHALTRIYRGVESDGRRIFPGWPLGAEVAASDGRSGWSPWIVRDGGVSISRGMAESFFRYMAFVEKDAKRDLMTIDFEKDPARLQWLRPIVDATDPDLSRYQNRGGRLLMYYGWADPALNAQTGIDYYEAVARKLGPGTDAFFRLFLVPGMFHCAGGVGTDSFDALGTLMEWVEGGKAPESIRASRLVDGKPVRTRPLCPYPQVARYQGSGSIDDAASFRCVNP